jgi:hypothetical protein
MTVNIADHKGSIVWEGVFYFALSDYPHISDWELRNIVLFIEYEKEHNRKTEIVCDDDEILRAVRNAAANPAAVLAAAKPSIISVPSCTNCKKGGCVTDFLCHTTEIRFVESIFKCGKLLSAVNARGKTGAELSLEPRNGAKDTLDYFDYVMFTWGNCFAGDSLVTERGLGGADPSGYFCGERFRPGVRFYFKYEDIVNHADYKNDGHHPAKVKDGVSLSDYLHCCIIPAVYKADFEGMVPLSIADRVFYMESAGKDIWEWCDGVYDFVSKMK